MVWWACVCIELVVSKRRQLVKLYTRNKKARANSADPTRANLDVNIYVLHNCIWKVEPCWRSVSGQNKLSANRSAIMMGKKQLAKHVMQSPRPSELNP